MTNLGLAELVVQIRRTAHQGGGPDVDARLVWRASPCLARGTSSTSSERATKWLSAILCPMLRKVVE